MLAWCVALLKDFFFFDMCMTENCHIGHVLDGENMKWPHSYSGEVVTK